MEYKKHLFIIFACLISFTTVYAQDNAHDTGDLWQNLNIKEKSIYVRAYLIGNYHGAILALEKYNPESTIKKIKELKKNDPAIKPNYPVYKIINVINQIYGYPKNNKIPIGYAIQFSTRKLNGDDISISQLHKLMDNE